MESLSKLCENCLFVFKENEFDYHLCQGKNKTPQTITKLSGKQSLLDGVMCPKCSQRIHLSNLDHHIDRCPYSICFKCQEYYPMEYIDEHKK